MDILQKPEPSSLENRTMWLALTQAHRHLAELKGLCESLPSSAILLETLAIQEAKDSSEIENIITTHDELFSYDQSNNNSPAAKKVQHYLRALEIGDKAVRETGLIRISTILDIQARIEQSNAGFRKVPGTVLKNQSTGAVVHTPPQDAIHIEKLMGEWVDFIHSDDEFDPLLKMAIAHHQFETIHPFYDGNGRTGRILNSLMMQRDGLLNVPVFYLSRYITSTKTQYYELLQSTRTSNDWNPWCLYIALGVARIAKSEIQLIKKMRDLMQVTKQRLKQDLPKIYSQELLNNLFRYPYSKIEFLERDVGVSRITAARYLDLLAQNNFVFKKKSGRTNFYINQPLSDLLSNISIN